LNEKPNSVKNEMDRFKSFTGRFMKIFVDMIYKITNYQNKFKIL